MSRTFPTKSGSFESLKISVLCGCNPKARQMRWMVSGAQPTALAIARSDQCVAPGGVVSSVSRIVSAISSSPILGGVPGRGSSSSPSSRRSAKRRRHLPTVLASAPTSMQIALFSCPDAAASTIRARRAIAWPVFCARAKDCSSRRSAKLTSIATAALPISTIHHQQHG